MRPITPLPLLLASKHDLHRVVFVGHGGNPIGVPIVAAEEVQLGADGRVEVDGRQTLDLGQRLAAAEQAHPYSALAPRSLFA